MSKECPDTNALRDLQTEKLAPDRAVVLFEHLVDCPECRKRFEKLQAEETLARDLRKAMGFEKSAAMRQQLQAAAAGDYEVLEEIGKGAGGIVFKARDTRLDKIVAIKCPTGEAGPEREAAVFDEARAMARIRHPNVAEIYAIREDKGLPFMVMEYVDGTPVSEAVERFTAEQTVQIFRKVLEGVAALHKGGMVHCDLKPGNILVDHEGTVKVLDFGIADTVSDGSGPLPVGMGPRGTPAYIAPEQSRGDPPDPAMDVFALGIILFEMLTGQRPFSGATVKDTILAVRKKHPPLPRALDATIPGPLQSICLTALEKKPSNRYPTARHFLLDLDRFLQGEPVVANPKMLGDILEHGIVRHLVDLERWQKDRLLTAREYDSFADKYDRLLQREELWVLDSRRISFSQVVLHLGAWACIVSTLLMICFRWEDLSRAVRIALPGGTFLLLMAWGGFLWLRRTRRVALVLFLAASMTWLFFTATALVTLEWLALPQAVAVAATPDAAGAVPDLLEGYMTNQQLLAAAAAWALLSLLLWCWTGTAAFSLMGGLFILALATAALSFAGLRTWLEEGKADVVAGWYMIPGAVIFLTALILDMGRRTAPIAAPLYVMGTAVLLAACTVVAYTGPTFHWLGLGDWIPDRDDEVACSFILNGLVFLGLGLLLERSRRSRWLRRIATLLFWLTPTHLLAPVIYFVVEKKWTWSQLPEGWTLAELALPVGALFFLFASVPKQMKSFFFSGLFYIAVSVVCLTHNHFHDDFAWPLSLAAAGLVLLLLAWKRPGLFERRGVAPDPTSKMKSKKPGA